MLSALVDLLGGKGVLKYRGWEKKIKERIKESGNLNKI